MKGSRWKLSSDVVVRRESVEFPPRCVVCGGEADGETIGLRGNPTGLFGVIPWLLVRTKRLEVPAHRRCGTRLRRAILLRNLALIIGVTAAVILAMCLGLGKWQSIGLVIAGLSIPTAWQVVRPLPFEFTHHRDHFKLMFADRDYAREAAAMNDGQLQ